MESGMQDTDLRLVEGHVSQDDKYSVTICATRDQLSMSTGGET